MQEREVDTQSQQQHTTEPHGGNVGDVAAEAEVPNALTEEGIAFVTRALQLGGSLLSLVETDPSAAIAELESAAQLLRRLTSGDTSWDGEAGQAQKDTQTSFQRSQQEYSIAEGEALEQMIQTAVERALAEKMKQILSSPRSLHGPPPSARRLADLIE